MFSTIFYAIAITAAVIAEKDDLSCKTDGQEKYENNVYYKCQNSTFMPIACAGEHGKKVLVGETFETSDYEMKCMQKSMNEIVPEIVACMLNGKKVGLGETLADQSYTFTCTGLTNQTLSYQNTGCTDDSGNPIKDGDTYRSGNFIFKCSKDASGNVIVKGAGCIIPSDQTDNGTEEVQLSIDQEYLQESFFYVCRTQKGQQGEEGVERYLAGCVNEGHKVQIGEKYHNGGYLYQCQQLEHGHINHAVVGCVDNEGHETLINGTWTEGHAPMRYIMQCAVNGKSVIRCAYETKEGKTLIEPGCAKKFDSLIVQCLRNGSNGISYRTLPVNGTSLENIKIC